MFSSIFGHHTLDLDWIRIWIYLECCVHQHFVYVSVVDPDPNESILDFAIRIRIRVGNASPDLGAWKIVQNHALQKGFCVHV